MASSTESGGEEPRLKEDRLAAVLVPNPGEGPPNATVLHVFVGKSTQANRWRLYLDANLASYVEVSEDDILHHQQLADDRGTLVWLPKSLKLEVTTVTSAGIQAEFLSGLIAAGRMARMAQVQQVQGVPAIRNTFWGESCFIRCITNIDPYCPPGSVDEWCGPSEFRPLCTIVAGPGD
jgi:hypothetical protein